MNAHYEHCKYATGELSGLECPCECCKEGRAMLNKLGKKFKVIGPK